MSFSRQTSSEVPIGDIAVSETSKEHLKSIQKQFSMLSLSPKPESTNGYLFSNDASMNLDVYVDPFCEAIASIPYETPSKITLFERNASKKPNLGIIVGNGYVFSLLDLIPADDILLIDIEPLVHYFIFYVKKLILGVDESTTRFDEIKGFLIDSINRLETLLTGKNYGSILNEMVDLGDKHFLSSLNRFIECKKALKNKELIPIKMDLFNINEMKRLGDFLKENNCDISFMNLTNLIDYDNDKRKLQQGLNHLPFARHSLFVMTAAFHGNPIFFSNPNELDRIADNIFINPRKLMGH